MGAHFVSDGMDSKGRQTTVKGDSMNVHTYNHLMIGKAWNERKGKRTDNSRICERIFKRVSRIGFISSILILCYVVELLYIIYNM